MLRVGLVECLSEVTTWPCSVYATSTYPGLSGGGVSTSAGMTRVNCPRWSNSRPLPPEAPRDDLEAKVEPHEGRRY
jgi:hypothetical protein